MSLLFVEFTGIMTMSGAVGILVSGIIIKRFKLSLPKIITMAAISSLIAIVLSVVTMMISCQTDHAITATSNDNKFVFMPFEYHLDIGVLQNYLDLLTGLYRQ